MQKSLLFRKSIFLQLSLISKLKFGLFFCPANEKFCRAIHFHLHFRMSLIVD